MCSWIITFITCHCILHLNVLNLRVERTWKQALSNHVLTRYFQVASGFSDYVEKSCACSGWNRATASFNQHNKSSQPCNWTVVLSCVQNGGAIILIQYIAVFFLNSRCTASFMGRFSSPAKTEFWPHWSLTDSGKLWTILMACRASS